MTSLESNITKLINGLKKIDMVDIALKATYNYEAEIIDTVTEDQLFDKGIDGTGKKIEPSYTLFTQEIKKEKGHPTNRVTLKDTGDFYDSIFMEKTKFPIFLNARDKKTSKIAEKYGEFVLDLTKDNKDQIVQDYIKEDIQEAFRKAYEAI